MPSFWWQMKETWFYTKGFPDAPDYDSEDDISWKSSDDDQDDEKQDDEDEDKNDVNETTQDDEDDDDEKVQDDDDEEQIESEDDGDDFIYPKLITHDDDIIYEEETDEDDSFDPIIHTPSYISSSDEEDSNNEIEGSNVEGAKSGGRSTYDEDQETILLCTNQSPSTPNRSRHSIPTNTNSDIGYLLQDLATNLPNFASLFGFDYRLKALRRQLSDFLRQTNQYAEALSSIPGIVDQYLANKMQEARGFVCRPTEVWTEIWRRSNTVNQQFLDSIDEGMKKVIKEQVKKEVSKITPKIEKLVIDQLESEVLVRSSKEANTSHAVAANLSELELKKILIDKMEANNSINRSDIQRQLYKALVDAYEADKILLDTYGDTVTIKRPRDGADDDQEPSAGTDRGSKRRRSGKEPASTSAPSETTTTTAGKTTTTGSKTHKQSASQSAPVEETMQTTDVFEAPAHQEFETGVHDKQAEEEVQHLPDWFQQPTRLPSPDHAWNKSVPAVHESVQPWLSNLARRQDPRESFDELTKQYIDFSACWHLMWNSHIRAKSEDTFYAFEPAQQALKNVFDKKLVIQRRVEDLQLGVESYQKKLNLTKPDTYRSNLRRRDAYTPTLNTRGSSTENKDKRNRVDAALTNTQGLAMNIRVNSFTMKMEILLESTSNKLMVEHAEYDESNTYVLERFITSAGNPVKKILLKLNLSDHSLCKDGGGGGRAISAKSTKLVQRFCYPVLRSDMTYSDVDMSYGVFIGILHIGNRYGVLKDL
ncbi:hypothetical protein Tco_0406966 [Tanacetum coccineum]